MTLYYEFNEDFLMHYGKKGMKWGVRKSDLRGMSRSERKQAKAKYRSNLKANRKQYRNARKKANDQYEKDISEYTKASDKINNKYDRENHKIEKSHNEQVGKVDAYLGDSHLGQAFKQNIRTSEINKKQVTEGKRHIAQEALDEKYSDMLSKADKRYSKSVKSAKNTYKQNKQKIKSGTYK